MTDKEAQFWIDVSGESLAYFAYCCARRNGKLIDDNEYKVWVDDCKGYFRKKMKGKGDNE